LNSQARQNVLGALKKFGQWHFFPAVQRRSGRQDARLHQVDRVCEAARITLTRANVAT
jgi:hypothetical protein